MTWSGAQRIASGARCPFLGRCSPRQKALGVAASPMEAGLAHCEHPARRNGLRPPHPAALERSARPTTRLAHPRRPQAASCSPSSTSPCGLKQQPDESTWVAGSSEATCVGRHRVQLPVLIAGEATQPAARNLMRSSNERIAPRSMIEARCAVCVPSGGRAIRGTSRVARRGSSSSNPTSGVDACEHRPASPEPPPPPPTLSRRRAASAAAEPTAEPPHARSDLRHTLRPDSVISDAPPGARQCAHVTMTFDACDCCL